MNLRRKRNGTNVNPSSEERLQQLTRKCQGFAQKDRRQWQYIFAVLLFILPLTWFPGKNVILGGESYALYAISKAVRDSFYTWNSSFSLGLPNLLPAALVHNIVVSILLSFMSPGRSQQVLFGFSLGGSYLAFYSLVKYLFPTKLRSALYIASLLYIFNPFYIAFFSWFPGYQFLLMFFPIVLRYLLEWLRLGNARALALYAIASFGFSVASINIGLFALIFFGIGIAIALATSEWKIHWKAASKRVLASFIVLTLVNLFWLLPMLATYRSLFGGAHVYATDFQQISIFAMPLVGALTLTEYYWFDKVNALGVHYYPYSTWYLLPARILVLGVLCYVIFDFTKHGISRICRVVLIAFLFSVFLTKGTAFPFGLPYRLLLEHVQFFGIYRSSDLTFPFISVLSLGILFASVLGGPRKNRAQHMIVESLSLVLCLFLGAPFIFGSIVKNYKGLPKTNLTIPSYWIQYSKTVNKSRLTSRVLVFPQDTTPFDNYTWGYNGSWLLGTLSHGNVLQYTPGYGSSVQENTYFGLVSVLYSFLTEKNYIGFEHALAIFNVGSVLQRNDVVPASTVNNQGTRSQKLAIPVPSNMLERNQTYGKLIAGTLNKKYFLPVIFIPRSIVTVENPAKELASVLSRPGLSLSTAIYQKNSSTGTIPPSAPSQTNAPTLEFHRINPTEYAIVVKNVKGNFPLVFSNSFDKGWAIIPGSPNEINNGNKAYVSGDYQGSIQNNNIASPSIWSLLAGSQMFANTHSTVNGYANSWIINLNELKKNFPNTVIHHSRGTYDLYLTLYYEPQSRFYIGFILSASTIVCAIFVLIVSPSRFGLERFTRKTKPRV